MALLLTPGEPAGVGPDLVLEVATGDLPTGCVAVADADMLAQRAAQLGIDIRLQRLAAQDALPASHQPGVLPVLHRPCQAPVHAGRLDPANAGYVLDTLRTAVLRAQSDGAGIVTGPVHKGNINAGGHAFSGHTEFLAQLAGGTPVMMLCAPGIRVALATTHVPLRAVADRINRRDLTRTLRILDADLRRRFAIREPRILVTGLNPHAGEDGHLGREEIDVIAPVIAALRAEGLRLTGPAPADSAFTPQRLADHDAVLTMYHDQGLPVLKALGFGHAVNVTLGLPIVRTSVDHGTALELAGTGKASAGSLRAAIDFAHRLLGSA